jgi:hypothetical protein
VAPASVNSLTIVATASAASASTHPGHTIATAGNGSCTPTSNTEIAPGKYSITAFDAGNKGPSKSGSGTLTIKK